MFGSAIPDWIFPDISRALRAGPIWTHRRAARNRPEECNAPAASGFCATQEETIGNTVAFGCAGTKKQSRRDGAAITLKAARTTAQTKLLFLSRRNPYFCLKHHPRRFFSGLGPRKETFVQPFYWPNGITQRSSSFRLNQRIALREELRILPQHLLRNLLHPTSYIRTRTYDGLRPSRLRPLLPSLCHIF